MSSTNGLRTRIASELNRALTDTFGNSGETIATVINRAINEAIKHYESVPLRWNEIRRREFATTSAGVRGVSLPADFIRMDTLQVKYGGSFHPVDKISIEEFDELDTAISATAQQGIPCKYVVYGNILELYPAPRAGLTLAASFVRRYLPTSITGSYTAVIPIGGTYSLTVTSTASHNNRINGWTTDGETLIRARAKASILINYLKKPDAIAEAAGISSRGENFLSIAEMQAYKQLADETFDAKATGKIRGYRL